VDLLADLAAGGDGHGHDLAVLAGGDLAPEGVVAPGELDDVDVEGFGHDRSSVGGGWWQVSPGTARRSLVRFIGYAKMSGPPRLQRSSPWQMPGPSSRSSPPAATSKAAGVLASIGGHVAEVGQQPLLIADENVWKLTGDQLSASFKEAGVDFTRETFGGVCSHREIDRITEAARTAKADVVVGIGGGTTLDTAKAAGHQAGIAWATMPTVASTDAPTSALSVVDTDDGVFEEYVFFPPNPDLVLVDAQMCANAPYRFLVSGMGDALATWVEARATAEARKSTMAGGQPTMAGLALARLSWETLIDYASRPGRPPSSTSSRPPWTRRITSCTGRRSTSAP
jgi:hypothetical protein